MTEEAARRILLAAVNEGRCAELLLMLFAGGSATVDVNGRLCIIDGEAIANLGSARD